MITVLTPNAQRPNMFLDLHLGGVIDAQQLIASVSVLPGGINSPSVDIQPQNLPPQLQPQPPPQIQPPPPQPQIQQPPPQQPPPQQPPPQQTQPIITTTTTTKNISTTPITRPLGPVKITRSSSGPSTGKASTGSITPQQPIVRPTFTNTIGQLAPPAFGLSPDDYFLDKVKKKNPFLQGQQLIDESRRRFDSLSKRKKKELVLSGKVVPVSDAQRAFLLGKTYP